MKFGGVQKAAIAKVHIKYSNSLDTSHVDYGQNTHKETEKRTRRLSNHIFQVYLLPLETNKGNIFISRAVNFVSFYCTAFKKSLGVKNVLTKLIERAVFKFETVMLDSLLFLRVYHFLSYLWKLLKMGGNLLKFLKDNLLHCNERLSSLELLMDIVYKLLLFHAVCLTSTREVVCYINLRLGKCKVAWHLWKFFFH